MANVMDVAKFFLKRGLDANRNTYDGNMKLQKLLFFANLISISEMGKPLFSEPIRAFSNGCVVENVRLRYKNDCLNFCSDSELFEPNFSQSEYDVLNLTVDIFGQLSARELSELNHSFSFWKEAYNRSQKGDGFKDKDLAIVQEAEMKAEVNKIKSVIEKYRSNRAERSLKEIINGVTFFYSSEFKLTDEIIEYLEEFSKSADDDAYSIYLENGSLVII